VPQLAALIPIRNFIDHGPSVEHGQKADSLFQAYEQVRARGRHLEPKPGNRIPIREIEVEVLTAGGLEIGDPVPGAGAPNPLCASTRLRQADPSENARSVGILVRFGQFRMIDLGDLTWNKEYQLVCPNNKVGTVEVYLSTSHGMDVSGGPEIVQALRPLVAIVDNGATKGGSPEPWQVIRHSRGLKDIWQLHYAEAGGPANNAPEQLIANLKDDSTELTAHWLKISAEPSGNFTVINSRNCKSETYIGRRE
jgi:competence protein ComEC